MFTFTITNTKVIDNFTDKTMPWNLRIKTIDVDQGESSFFLTWNSDTNESRGLLIDGGLRHVSGIVNQRVQEEISAVFTNHRTISVNGVIVTHYDNDHMRGIGSLLNLDNLYVLFELVASYAAETAALVPVPAERLATATGTTLAVFLGIYNTPQALPPVIPPALNQICMRAVSLVQNHPGCTQDEALEYGIQAVVQIENENHLAYNASLFPQTGHWWVKLTNLSKEMGRTFLPFADPAHKQDFIDIAVQTAFTNLGTYLHLNQEGVHLTYGRYRNSYVISPIPTQPLNEFYDFFDHAANGYASINNQWIRVPGVNRQRIQPPALGQEILWNGTAHPNEAPEMYICARNRQVWNPPASHTDISQLAINDNFESIATVVRFNRFWFYTGGDLPSEGEEYLAVNLIQRGIQRGGTNFGFPGRFAAFKCGHHGSSASTSVNFLNLIRSAVAIISCGGTNQFIIHDPQIIQRLNADPYNQRYCLTGASDEFVATHLQAPTKGRVTGSYADWSGNILITITQAQSQAADQTQRFFLLTYEVLNASNVGVPHSDMCAY